MKDFKITERFTPSAGKSFRRYLVEIEKFPVLDVEQEVELLRRSADGDMAARERLLNSNLRFVISVAKSYARDPDLFVELVAAGNMGLVSALEKFDHTKGFKFISYAVWHIRKEILQFLSENLRVVKIPTNKFQELKAVEEMDIRLTSEFGRSPSMEEIVERLVEVDDPRFRYYDQGVFQCLVSANRDPKSFQAGVTDESDSMTWSEIIPSEIKSPDSDVDRSTSLQFIFTFLNALNPYEREIVSRHHGLTQENGGENFPDIAQRFGVTPEAVRQRYVKAIRKLKIFARQRRLCRGDFSGD